MDIFTTTQRRAATFVGYTAGLLELEIRGNPYLTFSFLIPMYLIHQEYQNLLLLRASGQRQVDAAFPFAIIRIGSYCVIAIIGRLKSRPNGLPDHSYLVETISCLTIGALSYLESQILRQRQRFSSGTFSTVAYLLLGALCYPIRLLKLSFPTNRRFSLDQVPGFAVLVILLFDTRCIIELITILGETISWLTGQRRPRHEDPGVLYGLAASDVAEASPRSEGITARAPGLRSTVLDTEGPTFQSLHAQSKVHVNPGPSSKDPVDAAVARTDSHISISIAEEPLVSCPTSSKTSTSLRSSIVSVSIPDVNHGASLVGTSSNTRYGAVDHETISIDIE